MIYNFDNELETIRAFFQHSARLVQSEREAESARLARISQTDEEIIEQVLTSPSGANAIEQITYRAVVNELNSLCEFALQNTWIQLSEGKLFLPNEDLIFTANRGDIEKTLRDHEHLGDKATEVRKWPHWPEVKKIKELSEGFKHRQRLQPFPGKLHSPKNQWRSKRFVDPENDEWLSGYELATADVAAYIDAVEELFKWLGSKRMLWMS